MTYLACFSESASTALIFESCWPHFPESITNRLTGDQPWVITLRNRMVSVYRTSHQPSPLTTRFTISSDNEFHSPTWSVRPQNIAHRANKSLQTHMIAWKCRRAKCTSWSADSNSLGLHPSCSMMVTKTPVGSSPQDLIRLGRAAWTSFHKLLQLKMKGSGFLKWRWTVWGHYERCEFPSRAAGKTPMRRGEAVKKSDLLPGSHLLLARSQHFNPLLTSSYFLLVCCHLLLPSFYYFLLSASCYFFLDLPVPTSHERLPDPNCHFLLPPLSSTRTNADPARETRNET